MHLEHAETEPRRIRHNHTQLDTTSAAINFMEMTAAIVEFWRRVCDLAHNE